MNLNIPFKYHYRFEFFEISEYMAYSMPENFACLHGDTDKALSKRAANKRKCVALKVTVDTNDNLTNRTNIIYKTARRFIFEEKKRKMSHFLNNYMFDCANRLSS